MKCLRWQRSTLASTPTPTSPSTTCCTCLRLPADVIATQYWVHRILNELYSPDNFAGDEDTGATGAWYILSALGLFALCPGTSSWTLGSPLFAHATIKVAGGADLLIEARSRQGGMFLKNVRIDGKATTESKIEHADLLRAKHIVFTAD